MYFISIGMAATTIINGFQYGQLVLFLLVFVTTFAAVTWLLHYYSRRNACTLPAGPWHVPLIGSMQLFTTASHIEVTRLCKKYGKMFTLYIGSDPLVVFNDFEIIKEALVEHADIFSDRFTFRAFERIIDMKGMFISRLFALHSEIIQLYYFDFRGRIES